MTSTGNTGFDLTTSNCQPTTRGVQRASEPAEILSEVEGPANSFVFHYEGLKPFGIHYLQTHYLVTPRICNATGGGVE